MNQFQVRCIKMMSDEATTEEFDGIVAVSFSDEEYAALLVESAHAAAHGF